ncbi:hypothetical protein B0H17DRAFT_936937 [Mycena rosella]|uniref:Uncharacterized protein n=1 Tax=Mycena rosella TaxID=1033263 RepID=A0AAD7DHG2_MYCRO|nr:hypothetical protein B0H17DRAFT_936937 [Mycena rosella]
MTPLRQTRHNVTWRSWPARSGRLQFRKLEAFSSYWDDPNASGRSVPAVLRNSTLTRQVQLNLADLASVKQAATTFLAQESQPEILFDNGGVMACPTDITIQNHGVCRHLDLGLHQEC